MPGQTEVQSLAMRGDDGKMYAVVVLGPLDVSEEIALAAADSMNDVVVEHISNRAKKKYKVPSPAEVENARTPAGGWTRKQLAEWGVKWPPRKGWRTRLAKKWERENEKPETKK